MEAGSLKGYPLIIIGALIFAVALAVFFWTNTGFASPQEDVLEECRALEPYNGEGKINMLFFASEQEAEKYRDFLLSLSPFNEYKDDFNFFHIDSDIDCRLYKGIAILCDGPEVRKKAASCPDIDFITVLEEAKSDIRSSSYQNIMSINPKHTLMVFAHESGHAVFNFAEEYINDQKPPRDSVNCVNLCPDNFDGEIDGCFEGCSLSSYDRSSRNSVMRTLSPDNPEKPFDTFNSNYMKEVLSEMISENQPFITGQQIAESVLNCGDQKYNLAKLNDKGEVEEITQHVGCSGRNGNGPFRYEVTSNGVVIEVGNTNLNIFTDIQEENTEILSGETSRGEIAYITATTTGDTLNIFDESNNLVSSENTEEVGATPCQI